jgi:hypothetical protein
MCVFFISLPLYAQPSELFLKGQPLNIQSVVEFMVSSEWFRSKTLGNFSMCMCVCMHACLCMYVCMCVCMYACMYT